MDAYKIYRQLEEKNKKYNNYSNYEREDLIDIILENEEEKQQLISFLEDKIKGYNDEIQHCREVQKEYPKVKEDMRDFYIERDIYQEVLDFVKESGKDE